MVDGAGYYVWQGHAAIVSAWVVGLVFALWPHPITILAVQAAAVVGCEAVAFAWMRELVGQRVSGGVLARWRGQLLLAGGLVLLVADPWLLWTVSFDFHWEAISLLVTLVALRSAWRGKRAVWIWALLAVATSNLGATYIAGIGLSCLLAGRSRRLTGAGLLALGIGATLVVSMLHGDRGSAYSGYAYLTGGVAPRVHPTVLDVLRGAVGHAGAAVRTLWSHRVSLYADVAVGGLLGAVWPWTVGITAVVLAESGLQSTAFYAVPGFQNIPVLVLVPVGTVAVLAWLLSSRRRHRGRSTAAGLLLLGTVVAGVVGWAVVWLPRTSPEWLRVGDATAATLAGLESSIPSSDEVIVWQGVGGVFAGRRFLYDVQSPGTYPLRTPEVYVIVTPAEGAETLPAASSLAVLGELAATPHVTRIVDESGVEAYLWRPGRHQHTFTVPAATGSIPAWTVGAPGTVAATGGPPARWHLESDGPGPLLAGDVWDEGLGTYRATLRYASAAPLQLGVVDETTGALLANVVLPRSPTERSAAVPFDVDVLGVQPVFDGRGPFSIDALRASGDRLSVGVSARSAGHAAVYSVGLEPAPALVVPPGDPPAAGS